MHRQPLERFLTADAMLDYNTKFDRRESTTILDEAEIRGLVRSHLGGSEIESVSVLTGGFVNSNYRLVLPDRRSLVLRIAARPGALKKELRVLKHVQGAVPVPAVVAEDFYGPRPFALLEFIEGTLLSDGLGSLPAVDLTRVAFETGGSLHAIHSFDLGRAGWFDENFVFDPTFENFGGGLYEYICSNLVSGRVRERLGENLAACALEYVQANRDAYWSIPNSTRLIHCDYNLKNILIRKAGSVWKLAGVLDWEFAMAGSPLVDIGNFLRFEDELPPGFSKAFIKGYLSNSIGFPDNWRGVARLLDLAAMINFLDSEEETPKSFRTAVSLIAKTVGAR
ncbi:MAG: aminoglycoside phosphotransferase family protein [Verrucomicrobia bacterium]|nr:aminoglycoside phosphotransferase family protein [Verrucomicrobiota bacterium]